jgi:hypothetical protein
MPVPSRDFLVDTADLRRTQVATASLPALADGQALLRVDRFAFTANNITYAVFGEAMAYWQFFPAPRGWGRIPVWGFAEVIESRLQSIRHGERVYGYLPMSTHLVVQPVKVNEGIFMDGSAHRAALPAAYQLYRRVPAGGEALEEDQRALLHPLFLTAFLIDDFLADNALFGAGQVLLASASSKTALGLGFLLRARGVRVIGLTSARNAAFCERVGYYDEVLPYDQLARLPAMPSVYVDMAGDGKLLHAVHHHFRDQLKHSCMVGATHWEQRGAQHALPGAKPQFFFAPDRIRKRSQDWGAGGIDQRFAAAWAPFRESVGAWLEVQHGRGSEAVERVYREVLEGASGPQIGHVLSPA